MTTTPDTWQRSYKSLRSRWGLASLAALLLTVLLFFAYTPQQTEATHFLYGTIDWEVQWSGDVELTFVQGWRLGWFISWNQVHNHNASDNHLFKNLVIQVGLISVIAHDGNTAALTPATDSTIDYSSNRNRRLDLTIDSAYADEVNNDRWLFGTATRGLYPYAENTKGIGTVKRSSNRFILYFTRCCRAQFIEDLQGSDGDTGGISVFVDKAKRRYSLQSRTFPRQYQELKVALTNWVLPAVNRDDVYTTAATMVFLSKSGVDTLQTGGGDSGMNYQFSSGRTVIAKSPDTPYAPRGSGSVLQASALAVATNGAVTWTPDPISGSLKSSCSSLVSNPSSSTNFCAYASSFTVEDRGYIGANTTPTVNNKIAVQVDFLFIVRKKCNTNNEQCPPTLVGATTILLVPSVPQTIRYTARGNQNAQFVEIQTDPAPQGITLGPFNNKANTAGTNEPAYRDLTFDSDIDGPKGGIICLKASATGTQVLLSLGIFCPKYTVIRVDYMFLSGTRRTFTATEIKNDVSLSATVSKELDLLTRRPVVTGTDSALFNNWFTSSTDATVYTLTMTRHYNTALDPYDLKEDEPNKNQPYVPRVYTALRPFWSDPSPSTYQTFEFHTSMDLLDTETLRFGVTGGELFVFIDGLKVLEIRQIGPVTQQEPAGTSEGLKQPIPRIQDYLDRSNVQWTQALTSTQIRNAIDKKTLPTDTADSFNVDIFYTQRSFNTNGFFIEMANSTACSPLSVLRAGQYAEIASAAEVFNFDAQASNWQSSYIKTTHPSSTILSSAGLTLLTDGQKSTSAAAWTADKLKVLSGFEAKFSFTMTKGSGVDRGAGLAFVIQPNSNTARGTDGQGLGYSGLANAIAIEFDCKQDTGVFDSSYQHISVHKPGSDGITTSIENNDSWPVGSGMVANLPRLPFTFDNSTRHNITITFTPTAANWFLYVYVNYNVRPLYTGSFSLAEMASLFPNGAHLGFTTTNTNTNFATTVISHFSAVVIPPLAKYSRPVSSTLTGIAGNTLSSIIQLRDACDTPLSVEGEGPKLFGQFVHRWAAVQSPTPSSPNTPYDVLPATITDLGSGRYQFSARPLRAGDYTLYMYYREVGQAVGDGQPLGFDPWDTTTDTSFIYENTLKAYVASVTNAAVSAGSSQYIFGEMPSDINNTQDVAYFAETGAGVACYPSTNEARLTGTDKKVGRTFTNINDYNDWLEDLTDAAALVHCVNKGQYTGGVKSIIDSVQTITPTAAPSFTGINVAAAWTLARSGSSYALAKDISGSTPKDCATWSDRSEVYLKCVFTSGTVILESAPATWTNRLTTGRGMILLHPPSLILPSSTPGRYYAYLRDTYGNKVISNNVQLTHSAIPQLAVIGADSAPLVAGAPFWNLKLTTQTPGTHLLSIYDSTNESIGQAGTLTVSAGAAHYSKSSASGVTIGGAVDSPMSFTVKLHDLSGYHITEQLNKAEITAIEWVNTEDDSDDVPAMSWLQDPEETTGLPASTSGDPRSFWKQSDNQYAFTYTPTFAGTFYIKIYINSVCSGAWTVANGKDCRKNPSFELTATVGQIVAITAGPAATLSVVEHGNAIPITTSIGYVAGEQYNFFIQAKDKYGNLRYNHDTAATFSLQFLTQQNGETTVTTPDLSDYLVLPGGFTGDSIPFTSSGSGTYTLPVKFKKAQTIYFRIYLTSTNPQVTSGIITTGTASLARTTQAVAAGALAARSEFKMAVAGTYAVAASTAEASYEATNTANNVFFIVQPYDQYANQITPTSALANQIGIQYVSNGDFYYSDFSFNFVQVSGSVVIFGFKTSVAGTYTITPQVSSTSAPLTRPTSGYTHTNFIVYAAKPDLVVMKPYSAWPALTAEEDATVTLVEYDSFTNKRVDPSAAYTYQLFTVSSTVTCATGVTLPVPTACTLDTARPNQKCTVAKQPNGGTWNYYITSSPRPTGCTTDYDICSKPQCALSAQLVGGMSPLTDAFVAGIRYFNSKPTSATDITTANNVVTNFVTFGTPNTYKMDLNEANGATSADRYMLIYVIDPTPYTAGETRQLTLEPSGTASSFASVRATPIACSATQNQNVLTHCSRYPTANAQRLYIFEVRLNTVAATGKNFNFLIRFIEVSSVTATTPYTFNIVPGALHPPSSQWINGQSAISTPAGENFELSFSAYDQSGNAIKTAVNWARSVPTATTFGVYQYTPANANGHTYAFPATCVLDGENAKCTTDIPIVNGLATKFQYEKLEAIYFRASTTQPANVPTLDTFIARSIRTVTITPGPLAIENSILSLYPSGNANFEPREPVRTKTDTVFYFTAKDKYGNGVTSLTGVNIRSGAAGTTAIPATWSNVNRNLFQTTIQLSTASRAGVSIVAIETATSKTTDVNQRLRVRTLEPYKLPTDTDTPTDNTNNPSRLFNIVNANNLAAATNWATPATFTGLTIDSLNKQYALKIIDVNGLDYIYNLAGSVDYPNDNSVVSADMILSQDSSSALPITIAQLHTGAVASTPAIDGKFLLTFPTLNIGGQYYLRVYVSGQLVVRYTITIGPGKPKLDYTTFLSRSPSFVTAGEGYFQFKLFDRMYNLITTDLLQRPSTDPAQQNIVVSPSTSLAVGDGVIIPAIQQGPVDCAPDIHDMSGFNNIDNLFYALPPVTGTRFRFNSITFESDSSYKVAFTPAPRGTYTFNLTYVEKQQDNTFVPPSSEQVFSCNYLAPLSFIVDTGAPINTKSWFSVTPSRGSTMPTATSGYAGQEYTVDVTFLDADGNPSKRNTEVYLFWSPNGSSDMNTQTDLYYDSSDATLTYDNDGNLVRDSWSKTNLLSFTSIDLTPMYGYGAHRFTFKPRVANQNGSTFNFKLMMKNQDNTWHTLQGTNPALTNAPAMITTFTVLHGFPAQIIATNLPTNAVAGAPFAFNVNAVDAYDNAVTTDALSALSITVTRTASYMQVPIVDITEGLRWTLQPSQIVTSSLGVSAITFTPAWEGQYSLSIVMTSKDGRTSYATQPIPDLTQPNLYPAITVYHASCAARYLATNPTGSLANAPTQVCQSTGQCVTSISQCTLPRDKVECVVGQFINDANQCEALPLAPTPEEDPSYDPVDTDYRKCTDGSYIPATQTCPQVPTCPAGTTKCPNSSDCRSSPSLCPSTPACAPGLMVCPNGISCASTLAFCPTIPQSVVDACAGKVLCASGVCVNSAGECPTPPTCALGQVYCSSDGSCRADNDSCPTIPADQVLTPAKCQEEFGTNGVLCADGRTCASKWDNCPSSITCPIGSALCAIDNSCQTTTCPTAPTNPLLPNTSSSVCAVTEFRCPNGSCVQNLELCGSKPTCPASQPILCSDLNCKSSLALCNSPVTCSSRGLLQCVATGTCVDDLKYCSAPKTCSSAKPVLCSSGDCSASIDTCSVPLECPPALPYLCSSGNCRASVNDCPSLIGCPATSPLRCDDNSCVLALDLCKSTSEIVDPITGVISHDETATTCTSPLIKCPTGECSAAVLTCPTHVTCPIGTSRCPNGQCRDSCPVDATKTPTDLPTCASRGLLTCPISGSGYVCSSSIAACPQGITCPLFQPVKCAHDSTCAISLDDCPAVPTTEQPATKSPCFDGSWVSGLPSDCPTAVTCTPNMPIKCSDSTCRETIDECPIPLPCSSDATPYRCTSGQCVAAPWDCGPVLDGGIICDTNTPIKCPVYQGSTKCVADITKCDVYRNADGTNPSPGPEDEIVDPYTSPCSPGFTYCRDGSCQESPSSCPIKTCTVGFPVLCDDGSCAQSKDKCTNMSTGCPYNIPNRCPGSGKCVKHIMECPANPCVAPTQPCIDGTCRETCTLAANGCAVSAFRCNDGTCVNEVAHCSSQSNIQSANSCPPAMPYRCGNGLCVEKESQCVTLSTAGLNNCPVLCADGLCRDSTELCPLVKPCTADQVRCGDGSCRAAANCPNYNSCPSNQVRCKQSDYPGFKIQDGLCAEQGKCYSLNGCPLVNGLQQHRCTQNGRCVSDSSQCLVNLPTTNGCNSSTPHKCWDSSCVASAAECPQTNGCPFDKSTRCSSGACIASGTECSTTESAACPATKTVCADGSCVDKISQCKTSFNCPVDKPIRCYNGDCKQYSSKYRSPVYGLTNEQINAWTCPPVVSCPSTAYTMCANFKCVLSQSLCTSTSYPCSANEFMCTDGTCRPDTKWCGYDPKLGNDGIQEVDPVTNEPIWNPSSTKPAKCPVTLPVMCPLSGQCVSDVTSCNNNADPSSTLLTGSSSSPTKDANQEFQVQCFDGTWVNSYQDCRRIGTTINDEITAAATGTDLVPKCIDFCPNGECIVQGQNAKLMCGIIPACPVGSSRCFDGSCRLSCDNVERIDCAAQLGEEFDPLLYVPNVDGTCRSREESVGYLGCSAEVNERFHCSNRECAKDEADCLVVAVIGSASDEAKTKLGDSPYAIKTRLEEEAERLRKAQKSIQTPVNVKPISLKNVPNSLIASFVQQDTTTTTDPVTTPSRSCTKNCAASYPVLSTSILYSPLLSTQSYNIAPLATGATIQLYSGLDVNANEDMDFNIHPVGANMYFNATNKLTYSRISNFDNVEGFTAAQSVLSPVFSCSVGSGITEPFNIGVKFSSLIDRSQTPTPQPQDICLARLRRFPQHNYQVWMCEFTDAQRKSGDLQYSTRQSTEQPLRQAISYIQRCSDPDFESVDNTTPIPSDDETRAMNLLQDSTSPTGTQKVPAVYAYIHAPVESGQVYLPAKDNFWQNNVIWLLFVIIGGIFLIFVLVYAILRLSRYSSKTDKIKDEIANTEKEVLEMENYGGDKRRDEEVGYVNNPLAVSLEQENQLVENNDEAMARKQVKLQEQQEQQLERQEVIGSLEADNEAALAHLEQLRKKAAKPNKGV